MADVPGGYVLLHWSAKDSRQADSAQEFGVWCWFLASAARKSRNLPDGRLIERGQLLFSSRNLAERLQVPRRTLARYLKKWEEDGAIKTQNVGRSGTVVSLCNYDTYQPSAEESVPNRSQIETKCEPNVSQIGAKCEPLCAHTEKPKRSKRSKRSKIAESVPPSADATDPTEAIENASLRTTLKSWLGYKTQKRQPYKPASVDALIRKALRESVTHGVESVCGVIEDSMASNYDGITWDRLSRGSPGRGLPPKTRGELATERFLARHSNGDSGMRSLGSEPDLRRLRAPSG